MSQRRPGLLAAFVLVAAGLVFANPTLAQQAGKAAPPAASKPAVASAPAQQSLLDEGEKRFHANCGRCHQSPHRIPPRVVMTVERHMRERAMLTEEDIRAIVAFLTQ